VCVFVCVCACVCVCVYRSPVHAKKDDAHEITEPPGKETCAVLHFYAVCCRVLQCVALYCSVLHFIAVCCGVLQCGAVCCDEGRCR